MTTRDIVLFGPEGMRKSPYGEALAYWALKATSALRRPRRARHFGQKRLKQSSIASEEATISMVGIVEAEFPFKSSGVHYHGKREPMWSWCRISSSMGVSKCHPLYSAGRTKLVCDTPSYDVSGYFWRSARVWEADCVGIQARNALGSSIRHMQAKYNGNEERECIEHFQRNGREIACVLSAVKSLFQLNWKSFCQSKYWNTKATQFPQVGLTAFSPNTRNALFHTEPALQRTGSRQKSWCTQAL